MKILVPVKRAIDYKQLKSIRLEGINVHCIYCEVIPGGLKSLFAAQNLSLASLKMPRHLKKEADLTKSFISSTLSHCTL